MTQQEREFDSHACLVVLVDTFLVRTLLVPRAVVLLGRCNWWPSSLVPTSPPPRTPP